MLSHNTMGAFFSGTDNGDDRNAIRFSGVFGNLDRSTPSTIWRFNYMDKKYEASIEDIFEEPPQQAVEVPAEWLGKVKVSSPVVHQTRGRVYHAQGASLHEYPYTQPLVGHEDIEEVKPNRRSKRGKATGQSGNDRHDFYGFEAADAAFGSMIEKQQMELYGNSAADAAERRMAWEGMVNEASAHVEDMVREVRMEHLSDNEPPVGSYGLYEDMAHQFGVRVADAYWDIEHEMIDLQGQDELLGTLANDMIGLIDDDTVKLDLLRAAYNSLGSEGREKLATSGF